MCVPIPCRRCHAAVPCRRCPGRGGLASDAALAGLGIVFVNVDWKKSRHATADADRRNLELLKRTVTSIVTEMKPALVCFCEVGEVGRPLPDKVIPRLQEAIENAWREAALATEQGWASEGLAFAHPPGEPYLSAWLPERIDCRHHELLTDLYPASGDSRTAQMFLVTAPGENDEEGTVQRHLDSLFSKC